MVLNKDTFVKIKDFERGRNVSFSKLWWYLGPSIYTNDSFFHHKLDFSIFKENIYIIYINSLSLFVCDGA